MNDAAAALRAAAAGNLLNIGTANHLMAQAGAEVLPGDIINWAIRLKPRLLDSCLDRLKGLGDVYEDVAEEDAAKRVDWGGHDGSAGETFKSRWNQMRNHLTGSGRSRYRVMETQVQVMRNLRDECVKLQQALTNSINNDLSELRAEYVKELCETGDASVVESAMSGANLGASFGAVGGKKGIASGAAAGTVYGLIEGFMSTAEERTRSLAAFEESAQDLLSELPGASALTLPDTGDDNKVDLEYEKFEPDFPEWADSWEEGLDQPWAGDGA